MSAFYTVPPSRIAMTPFGAPSLHIKPLPMCTSICRIPGPSEPLPSPPTIAGATPIGTGRPIPNGTLPISHHQAAQIFYMVVQHAFASQLAQWESVRANQRATSTGSSSTSATSSSTTTSSSSTSLSALIGASSSTGATPSTAPEAPAPFRLSGAAPVLRPRSQLNAQAEPFKPQSMAMTPVVRAPTMAPPAPINGGRIRQGMVLTAEQQNAFEMQRMVQRQQGQRRCGRRF